jgi:Holliday junction resolvasome RuvABC DNA-binding subunit
MVIPIINKILKNKVIDYINIFGLDLKELVFDIELSEMTINSIEYDQITNLLILHVFSEDLDMVYDFDDLSEKDKFIIIEILENI